MITSAPISFATPADVPRLVKLLNSAYRGESAKKGWTHEADLIEGEERMDAPSLLHMMQDPDAVILKYILQEEITGCVYLQKQVDALYLGMLSVAPGLQSKGIGKQLLAFAEEHARSKHCQRIEMRVISKRPELIQWYERHGYHDSGKRIPFDAKPKFGIPREPIEFMIMEKPVTSQSLQQPN
ncbi:MAG: GNAT family N-acetyltransferase [Flavisolibacter sp.]